MTKWKDEERITDDTENIVSGYTTETYRRPLTGCNLFEGENRLALQIDDGAVDIEVMVTREQLESMLKLFSS